MISYFEYVSLNVQKSMKTVIFTLLAAMMANIPVGQKQQRQVRTAGTIQF